MNVNAVIAREMRLHPRHKRIAVLKLPERSNGRRPARQEAHASAFMFDELAGLHVEHAGSIVIRRHDVGLHSLGSQGLGHGQHSCARPATHRAHGRDDVEHLHRPRFAMQCLSTKTTHF